MDELNGVIDACKEAKEKIREKLEEEVETAKTNREHLQVSVDQLEQKHRSCKNESFILLEEKNRQIVRKPLQNYFPC